MTKQEQLPTREELEERIKEDYRRENYFIMTYGAGALAFAISTFGIYLSQPKKPEIVQRHEDAQTSVYRLESELERVSEFSDGLHYKPENFDPTKLHQYQSEIRNTLQSIGAEMTEMEKDNYYKEYSQKIKSRNGFMRGIFTFLSLPTLTGLVGYVWYSIKRNKTKHKIREGKYQGAQ